ncbi:MAG: S-methyl-5'-thioadenosine phosphorylase [Chloroflexi bacterium]|nr:MAG: S-methyl-5'-thioadenosine phosphorylase [Chloroflexota bacterium]
MSPDAAAIGVIGGSGFYRWLTDVESVSVKTPYGPPSAPLSVGTLAGRRVAFLPRHGSRHEFPPHLVNYQANVWAMRQLGVRRLIGVAAVGSLQPGLRPGDVVICDQFVDRTRGRIDTYFEGPEVFHVSAADPYCPQLRGLAAQAASSQTDRWHRSGVVVVIQGPRFSTRAENDWFRWMGWDVVSMTQYPEVILAREREMCYLNLSLVTDYDAGLQGDAEVRRVTAYEVARVMAQNVTLVQRILQRLVPAIPQELSCDCQRSLAAARLSAS